MVGPYDKVPKKRYLEVCLKISPNWQVKSPEPNLHFWVQCWMLIFPGVLPGFFSLHLAWKFSKSKRPMTKDFPTKARGSNNCSKLLFDDQMCSFLFLLDLLKVVGKVRRYSPNCGLMVMFWHFCFLFFFGSWHFVARMNQPTTTTME